MAFDLIIFDMDGTLVDSEPIANRIFHEHLVALGLDSGIDEARVARDLTGLSLPSCFAFVERHYGVLLPADFEAGLQAETFRRLESDLKPIPGVPEILPRIAQPKCVASSSEPDKIALSLRLCGIDGFFGPHLFSARQVARGKPHPDLFLHAAATMGHAPELCAVIEDSLPGATAGQRAGMTVFAYRPQADAADDAAFAALGCRLLRDMAELPALLA
ncbi:HAD family hydrolase [Ferrovibrio xuzhouensis]|uniref:HAD family hydrolase n=1 Tax=Ferrovibrio xuzhouensis TaxID=1576914 RepID=A0ABV7VHA2_9PROT